MVDKPLVVVVVATKGLGSRVQNHGLGINGKGKKE